ncbi:transferase hexapeptide domain protein [Aspergillus tanneri]|uniref:Dynactin subunit 6 n=1 Tax=Aspergillus tanneri TaxID=1220188 RepID=A0A5M9MRP4_9EURO|nr:uncharacterized protein ATNIH1004_002409 [Aspergillus tanneri]KAA8649735.1 hypothetical protein ATNIH1004_002409 [Aspergillus tanneri]
MESPRKSQTHLKPPPHHQPRRSSTSTTTTTTTSTPATPRAPVMAHPTATIAETAIFQGTHAVSIGAGTVIHPRTRIYSFSGPVIIDEACIIGEKSVIGVAAPPSSSGEGSSNGAKLDSVEGIPIRFSSSVTVGPTVTILPGVRVHSGASIEALATIKDRVSIGAHARICAGCEVSENTVIRDWMVVWGSGVGMGQRRRIRARGKMSSTTAVAQGIQSLEARVMEDARLAVLQKEREALSRLIGASSSGRRK